MEQLLQQLIEQSQRTNEMLAALLAGNNSTEKPGKHISKRRAKVGKYEKTDKALSQMFPGIENYLTR